MLGVLSPERHFDDDAVARLIASAVEQGFGERVDDATTLRHVANLVTKAG